MNVIEQAARKTRETVPAEQTGKVRQSLTGRSCRLDKVCRSHRRKRRGASVVEFAVVAPVFILLVFGMIEYGRMLMVQQVLTNASREGARRAVLDGTLTSDVEAVINEYLASGSVSGASISVTPDPPSSAGFGEPVTVAISVPFDQVSWLPSPMFLGGKQLSSTTVMRRESVQ